MEADDQAVAERMQATAAEEAASERDSRLRIAAQRMDLERELAQNRTNSTLRGWVGTWGWHSRGSPLSHSSWLWLFETCSVR